MCFFAQAGFSFFFVQFDALCIRIPWRRLLIIKNKIAAQISAEGRKKYLANLKRYFKGLVLRLNVGVRTFFLSGPFSSVH
jgi:hypothetical protein